MTRLQVINYVPYIFTAFILLYILFLTILSANPGILLLLISSINYNAQPALCTHLFDEYEAF